MSKKAKQQGKVPEIKEVKDDSQRNGKLDKKTLLQVSIIGLILTLVGIVSIVLLRDLVADRILPDDMKTMFLQYSLQSEGLQIPKNTEYITNNGKLFAFCQSLLSIVVATIIYIIGAHFGKKIYMKWDERSVKKIIKGLEFFVLILAIFTFTSKVNPNNNIEKYEIKPTNSSYVEQTNLQQEGGGDMIGYVKPSDLTLKDALIPVFKAPVIESAPPYKNDIIGHGIVTCIRNIDKISIYSEMITIILGIYIFLLKKFENDKCKI